MSKKENNVPMVDGVEEPVNKPTTAQKVIGTIINE